MHDIVLDHTVYFRTAAGQAFGREFECTLTAEWDQAAEMFELTALESDGVAITPAWDAAASPEESALWDRCQVDLVKDADLAARAWQAHADALHDTHQVA